MSRQTFSPPAGFVRCLQFTVAVQCIGLAGRYLLSQAESESDIYGLLYFDHGWPEATALAVDNAGVWSCLLAGLVVLCGYSAGAVREQAFRSRAAVVRNVLSGAALCCVALWFLAMAVAHTLRGGPFSHLTLAEHAVRYGAPIALLAVAVCSGRWLTLSSVGILRLATAATFAGHGYVALQHHGHFVDLVLLTDARWFGTGISQDAAETALTCIGWIDVAVAVALVLTRWPVFAAYAALWGAVTATSRMTALGIDAWPEILLRAANCGAPLALLLFYQTECRPGSTTPDETADSTESALSDES